VAKELLGAAYGVWTIVTQSHVTNSSVLLILLSVVILLVGYVGVAVHTVARISALLSESLFTAASQAAALASAVGIIARAVAAAR